MDPQTLGEVAPPNAQFYVGTVDFPSIASGASDSREFRLNNAGAFVVTHLTGLFWITALLGSSVAGSPLVWDSNQATSSNTMPNMAMLEASIVTNEWQWTSRPVRASLLLTDARMRNWFVVPPRLANNSTTTFTFKNNAAVTVAGQVSMVGYRIP